MFTQLKVSHYCELLDKLVPPVLYYGSEVWGSLKRKHTRDHSCSMFKTNTRRQKADSEQFIWRVRKMYYKTHYIVNVIRYWLK